MQNLHDFMDGNEGKMLAEAYANAHKPCHAIPICDTDIDDILVHLEHLKWFYSQRYLSDSSHVVELHKLIESLRHMRGRGRG